jgi:hypothetical protein
MLLVGALLTLGALASCARTHQLAAPPSADSPAAAPDWHATKIAQGSHRIMGYRTIDGRHRRFESTVRLVGDSLEFEAVAGGAGAERVVLPASEVAAVDMFAPQVSGILIAAVLVVTLVFVVYRVGAFSHF